MAETERKEQALLVGINNMEDEDDFDRSMEELERLAQACNMETVGILTQKLETVNNALYLGSGKVQELKEFAENIDADIIVFDNSLTPTQLRNLQQILKFCCLHLQFGFSCPCPFRKNIQNQRSSV